MNKESKEQKTSITNKARHELYRVLPPVNWGKLYDKHSACLQGKPTYFCGCRWDNVEWCYECLNQCVENKTLFQKVWILIQLNYGSLIGWIGWQIRKFKNRNIQLPF